MKLEKLNDLITVFSDGPSINEINLKLPVNIDGYTFNPSLFKKNKASNYLEYSREILKKCQDKPVSLEVIADTEKEMIRQALELSKLDNNVYVKIPIIFTNGESTKNVLLELVSKEIKINITAIFTIEQVKEILPIIKDTHNILSIFIGRIYDAGHDGEEKIREINDYVHQNSQCKTLWASTRMGYDIVKAIRTNTDIITMQIDQIKKLNNFNKNLLDYSKETVQQFFEDAKISGYKF
jgi:transaldolase